MFDDTICKEKKVPITIVQEQLSDTAANLLSNFISALTYLYASYLHFVQSTRTHQNPKPANSDLD